MKINIAEKKRQTKITILLYCFVTVSFLVPVAFLIFRLLTGSVSENEAGYHSKADYMLMLIQCVLGLVAINLPTLLSRTLRFEIPMVLYGFYIVFLYCAIFLGEVRSFYYAIPYWDSILHGFSSLMLGFFGYMVIVILNRDIHIMISLSPLFAAVFAFCFALSIGSMWEIYEYVFDGLLNLNMQKFITAEGQVLSGHAALGDTMKDLIIDAAGAAVSSVVGYFAVRKDKKWIQPTLIECTRKDDC